MNFSNVRLLLGMDSRFHFRRPLFWILILLLGLITFGLAGGNVAIQSGDTAVGGEEQAWLTSEFSNALVMPLLAFLFYSFFAAVAAGMLIPRDEELNVGPVLHATSLTPREYIWSKFTAVSILFLVVLVVHILLMIFFNHLWPNADAERIRGPFHLIHYLRPAVFMVLPFLIFICGSSFAIGTITKRPILVFAAPTALFLISVFFLWDWSPSDLNPKINNWLMWLEPSGFRWINETWMKLDRGVEFYNREAVGYDVPFLISRFVWAFVGFFSVFAAERKFKQTIRASQVSEGRRWFRRKKPALAASDGAAAHVGVHVPTTTLQSIGMTVQPPGFLRTVLSVVRFEVQNLVRQPGLYIFVPLILIEVIFSSGVERGAFDTPILLTPGTAALIGLGTLQTLVCLLLLFYTVESVLREKLVGLSPIFWSAPTKTGAVLLGKTLANSVVAVAIVGAAILGSVLVLLQQGTVTPSLAPYLLIWGLLLLPTFVAWSAYVTFLVALTGNRYTTYAIGLGTMIFTAWKSFRGEMNWVGNWNLANAVTWTDFGGLDPNGSAILMNRVFWSLVALFIVALTIRFFSRRDRDSARTLDRLGPRSVLISALKLLPVALPAIVLGSFLWVHVGNGSQGDAVERREKEYWGRNLLTWGGDVNLPRIAGVDLDLTLDPSKGHFAVIGEYVLTNRGEDPIQRFPMSVGDHFENVTFTLNGEAAEPENRARLYAFKLDEPLAVNDSLRVGFSHDGSLPQGINKNGGGMGQFVAKSGVVLTSFGTSFLPVPWFEEGRGQDEDNRTDPKEFADGYWEGETPPGFTGGALFDVRTKITGPDDFDYHGVGVRVGDQVLDGKRTVTWESDYPVNFFNVVAGKWDRWEGEGVEIYYHPTHEYNVEEMGEALAGARKYYSEWFYEYPWQDLRLNEFAALASYAQGFPTNITFSESIGFLTRSTPETQTAFLVTAHETAHQWWGNIILPGVGPGGNILSEGMAHFSTVLLIEQMQGERERQETCKRLEESYGDSRRVDSERSLIWTDGSKGGDTTVTYDKGGWVFLMLHDLLGRETSLTAIHDFVDQYHGNTDYPLLQDYIRVLRTHAPDLAAFDEFVEQWFYEIVIPEYRFTDTKEEERDGHWFVTTTIENAGTGTFDLDVAVVTGERFPDREDGDEGREDGAHSHGGERGGERGDDVSRDDAWQEQRKTVRLAAGEKQTLAFETPFDPSRILVDPDVRLLMLQRDRAVAEI